MWICQLPPEGIKMLGVGRRRGSCCEKNEKLLAGRTLTTHCGDGDTVLSAAGIFMMWVNLHKFR